jgi:DNA transformation protein
MATSQSTIDFLLDQLGGCDLITARKMFGEYCLYVAGKPVGLVCDNQLFLKNLPAVRAMLPEVVESAPYPGARAHLLVSADCWEDRESLCQWVRAIAKALSEAPAAKSHKSICAPKKR